jgi:hypothetical protein
MSAVDSYDHEISQLSEFVCITLTAEHFKLRRKSHSLFTSLKEYVMLSILSTIIQTTKV